MAVKNEKRSSRMEPWAIKLENYLLLLRKEELLELWRTTRQSLGSVKYKSPEQIRQAILSLPPDTLGMLLRERSRRIQKAWHE